MDPALMAALSGGPGAPPSPMGPGGPPMGAPPMGAPPMSGTPASQALPLLMALAPQQEAQVEQLHQQQANDTIQALMSVLAQQPNPLGQAALSAGAAADAPDALNPAADQSSPDASASADQGGGY